MTVELLINLVIEVTGVKDGICQHESRTDQAQLGAINGA